MIPVYLVSPDNDSVIEIESKNLLTVTSPWPPRTDGTQRVRLLRQFLTQDGTSGGTSDMRVDGSSTSVEYFIESSVNHDRYIKTLSFSIVDASATLSKFGNLSALTNGCQLEYADSSGTVTVHDALQSNFDVVRLCGGEPAFGDAATAFRANNVLGSAEGYVPVLDFTRIFGMPWGLPLERGRDQRLIFRIRDDLSSGMDGFDVIAYGLERL